jgi:hypothetical protein
VRQAVPVLALHRPVLFGDLSDPGGAEGEAVRTTTIRDPDGKTTTITQRGGCSGCLTAFLVILVVLLPLTFPLWAMVSAYVLEATLLALALPGVIRRGVSG